MEGEIISTKTIKLTLTNKRLDGEGRGGGGALDSLQDLLHAVHRRRRALSRVCRSRAMALAIRVGLEEGGRVMGRVARRRRGGRPNISTLMVEILVSRVQFLVVHRR
jgi:hypothetical protein